MAGATAAVVLTPIAAAAVGFGAGGITAGSLAAKAMSVAWTTGMGAGAVATMQSLGAAGLTAAQTVVVAGVGGGVATLFGGIGG